MGRHNSRRVDEGIKKNTWNLLAIRMQSTNRTRSGEDGEQPATCDPGSDA